MKNFHHVIVVAALAGVAFPVVARAQLQELNLHVVESPALDGQSFGEAGQYEWLRGTARGAVDPDDPQHRDIVNLDLAPRNAAGKVEYEATVELYRPVDMTRWNRAIYHTVPNRGGAGAAEPVLLERGFALLRVGWQGDIPSTDTNIVSMLPVATREDGTPLTGPAMEEFIFNNRDHQSFARLTYPTASLDPASAHLTVRRNQTAPRLTPDDLAWTFASPTTLRIDRPAGFDGGAIYELTYQATDPIVMGVGFVAMRDTVSFLRHDLYDPAGHPNPLAEFTLPDVAISLGVSQSGRVLRDFLYQGFNEDLDGRIVFDGLHPNIAGSRKTFTNYAFSQPGRWQKQHEDHLFPGDQFPFTYATLTDSVSGRTDGLLEKCSGSDTCPKIIHSDGEAELWQARASLIVTDADGADIQLPDNVRVFLIAGTQHGGGPGVLTGTPSRGICQNLNNPLSLTQIRLALSIALYEWVATGTEPPASRFPTVDNGGLVPATAVGFPRIPNVKYSGSYNPLVHREHDVFPPRDGAPYTVLVGAVNADGNMTTGVVPPTLATPVGTHTGWNLRRSGFGDGSQCRGAGSFIPFATDAVTRSASGDPRYSLKERYPSLESYVAALSAAADALVDDRLLLRRHADELVATARRSGVVAQ